jgi:hypothetical protein
MRILCLRETWRSAWLLPRILELLSSPETLAEAIRGPCVYHGGKRTLISG